MEIFAADLFDLKFAVKPPVFFWAADYEPFKYCIGHVANIYLDHVWAALQSLLAQSV